MTTTWTGEGQAAVFVAIDHHSAECVCLHAARRGTRFEALEPLRQGVWGIAEGRYLVRKILGQAPIPTALICGNGYFAIGAMLECQRQGIRVPDDISIVGYDDFEIMSELPISITTVRVSGVEVGRRCAHMLMAKLAGKLEDFGYECIAELVIRESSGPPRKHEIKLTALNKIDEVRITDQMIQII